MNNLDYAKRVVMLLKDKQQLEATAMPRLAGQREEMVLPEPKSRVIWGDWDDGKTALWALGP